MTCCSTSATGTASKPCPASLPARPRPRFAWAGGTPGSSGCTASDIPSERLRSAIGQAELFAGSSGLESVRERESLSVGVDSARDSTSERPDRHPRLIAEEANMSCRGLLVVSDNAFPGWTASVDGTPAKIHTVDLAIRGIVEAGRHDITMSYHPLSVKAGLTLTVLGIAASFALALRREREGTAILAM